MYKTIEEELDSINFEEFQDGEYEVDVNNAETFLKDTLHIEKADYA